MVKTSHEFFMAATRRASAKRCQSYIEKERPDVLNSFADIATEGISGNPYEAQRLWGQGFDVVIRKDFVRVKLFKHNVLTGYRNTLFPNGMPLDEAVVVFPETNRKSVFL